MRFTGSQGRSDPVSFIVQALGCFLNGFFRFIANGRMVAQGTRNRSRSNIKLPGNIRYGYFIIRSISGLRVLNHACRQSFMFRFLQYPFTDLGTQFLTDYIGIHIVNSSVKAGKGSFIGRLLKGCKASRLYPTGFLNRIPE